MSTVLEVKGVSKSFGKFKAVDTISFDVMSNEIVGFIGPNGAGKTTTLKMISDLIRPSSGDIIINGYNLKTQRTRALSQISGIIENPGLYPSLSGMENLKFIAELRKVSKDSLNEAIEITGLGDRLKRTVHKYSLGMKQRLALGMCILTKPAVLLLDEPTNGLDPSGTIELRDMIHNMAGNGTSVLFSSHLLGEVERLADRVIYISEGKMIDNVSEQGFTSDIYILSVSNNDKARDALNNVNGVEELSLLSDNRIRIVTARGIIGKITKCLAESNIEIQEIEKQKPDLESIYRKLFAGKKAGENQ